MSVISLSWYLCVLFALAAAASSAITIAPAGQAWLMLEMGTLLAFSIGFAAVAVIVRRFHILQPKWLLRSFQVFAVLATIVVLTMVVG